MPYANSPEYSWQWPENHASLNQDDHKRHIPHIEGRQLCDTSCLSPHSASFYHAQYGQSPPQTCGIQTEPLHDLRLPREVLDCHSPAYSRVSSFESLDGNNVHHNVETCGYNGSSDNFSYPEVNNQGSHGTFNDGSHGTFNDGSHGTFNDGSHGTFNDGNDGSHGHGTFDKTQVQFHHDNTRYQNCRQNVQRETGEHFGYAENTPDDVRYVQLRCDVVEHTVHEPSHPSLELQHETSHVRSTAAPMLPNHQQQHRNFGPTLSSRHATKYRHKTIYNQIISHLRLKPARPPTKSHARAQKNVEKHKRDHTSPESDAHFPMPSENCGPSSENIRNDHMEQQPSRVVEFKQVKEVVADEYSPSATVRTVTMPLEIEEGELVDDSDEDGALVIDDESEGHEVRKFHVIKKRTDESQSGDSQLSPPLIACSSKSVSADILCRIEAEIQEAKEATSGIEQKRDNVLLHVTQEIRKDDPKEEPGLYQLGEPEHLALELLKQAEFVKQLCKRTEQKYSSFTFLWIAVGQVKDILDNLKDSNAIERFQAYVAKKLPKCFLNSQPLDAELIDQHSLYAKEIEFFHSHYHRNELLWKKNILQYYRYIVQYHRHATSPIKALQNKCTSTNEVTPASSQNSNSKVVDYIASDPVPHEKHHQDHVQDSRALGRSDHQLVNKEHSNDSLAPPTLLPSLSNEGPANVTLAPVRSSEFEEAQYQHDGQPFSMQQDKCRWEDAKRHHFSSMHKDVHGDDRGSFEPFDDLSSGPEVATGGTRGTYDRLASAQDIQLQGLQNFEHHLLNSEATGKQMEQTTLSCQTSLPHSNQMQPEEQTLLDQTSFINLASIQHNVCPPDLVDTGLQQQNLYSPSVFCPPPSGFMPLCVTAEANGPNTSFLKHSGTPDESSRMWTHGHHDYQPQQLHAHSGRHGEHEYHGSDLHGSRQSVDHHYHRSNIDEPYSPSLPLMELASYQDNAEALHAVGRVHSGSHGHANSDLSHLHNCTSSALHRDDRPHFGAPHLQLRSNMPHVGSVDSHSAWEPPLNTGGFRPTLRDKDVYLSSYKYKEHNRYWPPRLSNRQRKRLQNRSRGRIRTMDSLPHSSYARYQEPHATPKSSGSYRKQVDMKERKHRHGHAKIDLSDEDLEVLELRKEVIMSIVSNNAEKAAKKGDAVPKTAMELGVEGSELEENKSDMTTTDDKGPAVGAEGSIDEGPAVRAEGSIKEHQIEACSIISGPVPSSAPSLVTQVVITTPQEIVAAAQPPHPLASSADNLLKSTLVQKTGEDSPVLSPVVSALRREKKKSRSASPLQKSKPNTGIKVIPRDSQTHKVQEFSIQITGTSDTSESEIDSDELSSQSGQHSFSAEAPNALIRKDIEQTRTLQLLPLDQQQEYNELMMKLAMAAKTKAKAAQLHMKRSVSAVMMSKQLKTSKPAPGSKVADTSEIKKRIGMCASLIETNRSAINSELLAQDQLLKKQASCEQELDEITLRVELLEKKLRDAREERHKCKAILTEIRNRAVLSKEVVDKHNLSIKEKENEVRLLERKLGMISQQQLNTPQAVLADSSDLDSAVTKPVLSVDIANNSGSLDKAIVFTGQDYEAVSPVSYPLYESVSDTEEADGNGSFNSLCVGAPAAHTLSPAAHTLSPAAHTLSPLETEMISDTESVEFNFSQNKAAELYINAAPSIVVETISDSEDPAEQPAQGTSNTLHTVINTESTNCSEQMFEQVSDMEGYGLEDNEAISDPVVDGQNSTSLRVIQSSSVGITDQSFSSMAIIGIIGQNPSAIDNSVVRQNLATSFDAHQNSLVVVEPSTCTEIKCVSSTKEHSDTTLLPQNMPSLLSSVPEITIPSDLFHNANNSVTNLQQTHSSNKLGDKNTDNPIHSKTKVTSIESVAAKMSAKTTSKKTTKNIKSISQHSSGSSVSKLKLPSQNRSATSSSSSSSSGLNTKPQNLTALSDPQKRAQVVKHEATAKPFSTVFQPRTGTLSVTTKGPHSSKLQASKSSSAQNSMPSHKMHSSAFSAMSHKFFHKSNPKRLVHSKATELHGRLQKELLALEALKATRKVKTSKVSEESTSKLSQQTKNLASPKSTISEVTETNTTFRPSEQFKQAVKLLGIQSVCTSIRETFATSYKSDWNRLLNSPLVATCTCTTFPVSFESLIVKKHCADVRFVPEHVILATMKLQRQQHHHRATNNTSLLCNSDYISPLLNFHSYRLSPHFMKFASLTSLTYSNKIDPLKMFCRFELLGYCNDSGCPAQHFRDVKLSKEEMARDLVSYCPSLAGCSDDLSVVDDSLPESQQMISTKVDLYAKNLCDSLTKLSEEQLCTYIAHKVTLERKEVIGCSGIDLEEHAWYSKPGTSQQGKLKEAFRLSDMVCHDTTQKNHWNMVTDNSEMQRYFRTESATVDTQNPCDPTSWAKKAQMIAQTESLCGACDILKQGLLIFPSSEEIWVHLLQATHACKDGKNELHDSAPVEDLWSKALESCSSYSVIFECIHQANTYSAKRKLITEGYNMFVVKNCSTTERSHRCLELLLNAVLLEQICEAHDQAIQIIQQALLPEPMQGAWTDVRSNLMHSDFVFALLCFGHYIYHTCLPVFVFPDSDGACPPVQIINKEPFLIPLSSEVACSNEKHDQVVQLFQASLFEIVNQAPSFSSDRMCIALCQNLIRLEVMCGNIKNSQILLTNLLSISPSSDGLWLLLAKVNEQESTQRCIDTLSDAVMHCPQSPDIYYCAASALMAAGQTSAAVNWLMNCLKQFYDISEGMEFSVADMVILYRKLLGQLVPYQYNFPSLSSLADVKTLQLNCLHLWKCYILLIKLPHSMVGNEYYHSSPEDAYESAIHCVHDQLRLKLLWREYLTHLKMQVLETPTAHSFKVFSECVERCLEAITSVSTYSYHLTGQPSVYNNYAFHNEILGLLLDSTPPNSSYLLFNSSKYLKLLPRNAMFVSRLAQCALSQIPTEVDFAQVIIANYLAEDPTSFHLWKMAISLELRLDHTREARWMYRQATLALPLQASLWKEFLLFELSELQLSRSSTSIISWLVERCNQIGLDIIPFAKQVILQS